MTNKDDRDLLDIGRKVKDRTESGRAVRRERASPSLAFASRQPSLCAREGPTPVQARRRAPPESSVSAGVHTEDWIWRPTGDAKPKAMLTEDKEIATSQTSCAGL
jgi:hypothetical protein